MMQLPLTRDQQSILRTATSVLASHAAPAQLRRAAEAREYDPVLEALLVEELGWCGIAVPERAGGFGWGLSELVVIAEELGRTLAPARVIMTAAAASCLAEMGDAYAGVVQELIEGRAYASVGWQADESGPVLVADGAASGVVLVFGLAGVELLSRPGLRAEDVETIDATRRYAYVSGMGVPMSDPGGRLCAFAEVALAAELVGVARAALERAVAYAKERHQFGRPIGTFQAVAHRCADMALETEAARAAVRHAAESFDAGMPNCSEAASVAVVLAVTAAKHATGSAIQVHGGNGFTWDDDLHFFFKRAQVAGAQLNHIREHRRRLALGSTLSAPVDAAASGSPSR